VSLPLLAVYLIAMYVPVTAVGLAWGGLAGIAVSLGLVLFYRALSAGAMTVVAPVTGVTSAAIPVVWDWRGRASFSFPASRGGFALLAIALVSISPRPPAPAVDHLETVGRGARRGYQLCAVFILIAVAGKSADGLAGCGRSSARS
jgi:hypothetical protein